MRIKEHTTSGKALEINLDHSVFGTFAEIGGGQEVARIFFRAGGASRTIAKTISAYDKNFSDTIYKSKKDRYVSENRLGQMLHAEYSQLTGILSRERGANTRFFAFANTVETINYKHTNTGHGWLGIRFQLRPGTPPNTIILHTVLHENDTLLQQATLGILGVNLIYASFNCHDNINKLIISLSDNLSRTRLDINMLSITGHDFEHVDNRLISLLLVKHKMTPVSVFDCNGRVQQPGDMLFDKDVIVLRGSFRPVTFVELDMLKSAIGGFSEETGAQAAKEKPVILCEITLDNLLSKGRFHEKDFLDRVNMLNGLKQHVMISNFREFFRLSEYLAHFNINRIRLVMGTNILKKILDKGYYSDLNGGILEALGRLFGKNVKLYVYPYLCPRCNRMLTTANIEIETGLLSLYKYLTENNYIADIRTSKVFVLPRHGNNVPDMIKKKDNNWKKLVPGFVSRYIVENGLFG